MADDKKLSHATARGRVLDMLKETKVSLENVRHLMVYEAEERAFSSEDVHEVAMVQFELGKLTERFDPSIERKKR